MKNIHLVDMCQCWWSLMPFMHSSCSFLQGTHGRLPILSLKEVIHLIENKLKCEHNIHIFQVVNCKYFHARIVDHILLDKIYLKLCKCVCASWYIICGFKLSADLSTFYFIIILFLAIFVITWALWTYTIFEWIHFLLQTPKIRETKSRNENSTTFIHYEKRGLISISTLFLVFWNFL